jgi:hypothetical protein
LYAFQIAHRRAILWLGAAVGVAALMLATPALSRAEDNPNNYTCLGKIAAGEAEEGSEGQQVKYSFYCDGPITGYQLQAQVPITGESAAPLVSALAPNFAAGTALKETFSCSGEVPGYALNCVGAAKTGFDLIAGQFAIESKLCVEPRVDPLLTVTYAYLEKGVVTQAISGPFDLGRPTGCPADSDSGYNRLNPKPAPSPKKKHKTKKKSSAGKSARRRAHGAAHR